ncbi:MAG: hypothetical protein IJU51_07890, partial [Clostridia bacterium]|nr:hypothetical protein [Clostridia bacterium]
MFLAIALRINKFKKLKPDVVIPLTLAVNSGVAVTKQLKELGVEWVTFGINYPMQAGFLDQAGSAAEGLCFVP